MKIYLSIPTASTGGSGGGGGGGFKNLRQFCKDNFGGYKKLSDSEISGLL